MAFMKRTVFILIMAALPIALFIIGLITYVNIIGANNLMNRLIADYSAPSKPLSPYEANWAEVVVMVPVPYVGGNYQPNVRGDFVNTNDLGYRGVMDHEQVLSEARMLKSQGFNIVVLTGGSAAFGAFSDNDHTTISAYLNRFLLQLDRKVKVYNFAMGSYTSDDELASLVMYAADTHPDLLVVMDGYNDAVRGSRAGDALAVGVPDVYATIRQVYPATFHSSFLDRKYQGGSLEMFEAIRKRYLRNLRRMKSFMNAIGGEILIATQPVRGYRSNTAQCQEGSEDFQSREGVQDRGYIERVFGQYPALIQSGKEAAGDNGYVPLSDVFSKFPDACTFFVDRMHMSSAGQKLVARELLPHILRRLHMPAVSEREAPLLENCCSSQ